MRETPPFGADADADAAHKRYHCPPNNPACNQQRTPPNASACPRNPQRKDPREKQKRVYTSIFRLRPTRGPRRDKKWSNKDEVVTTRKEKRIVKLENLARESSPLAGKKREGIKKGSPGIMRTVELRIRISAGRIWCMFRISWRVVRFAIPIARSFPIRERPAGAAPSVLIRNRIRRDKPHSQSQSATRASQCTPRREQENSHDNVVSAPQKQKQKNQSPFATAR